LYCRSRVVDTVITVGGAEDDAYSTLFIKTLDRPGLLVEIVKVLKDHNDNVISAEVRKCRRHILNCSDLGLRVEIVNMLRNLAGISMSS